MISTSAITWWVSEPYCEEPITKRQEIYQREGALL